MKLRLITAYFTLVALAFSFPMNAQNSNVNQVIEDLKSGNEDPIKDILAGIYPSMKAFADTNNIEESGEKKIAWLLTVRSLMQAMRKGAEATVWRTPWVRKEVTWDKIWAYTPSIETAENVILNHVKNIAKEPELTVSLNAALEEITFARGFSSAVTLATDAVKREESIINPLVVASNIAQWSFLNIISSDFNKVFTQVYSRTLAFVKEQRTSVVDPSLIELDIDDLGVALWAPWISYSKLLLVK